MHQRYVGIYTNSWPTGSTNLPTSPFIHPALPERLKSSLSKEQMMQSAILTCSFLHLQKGDNALLCMPLQYIAGKMVVVRALVAGLTLILRTPSGHPLADVETPLRFAAMIPLQVYNTLQVPEEKERLCRTEILIIGGRRHK